MAHTDHYPGDNWSHRFMAQVQRIACFAMSDKVLHTIQLFFILVTAVVLIIFAHQWLPPDVVFTSMIAGLAGIVGSRIASNGYTHKDSS